jgi:hypothetical protein
MEQVPCFIFLFQGNEIACIARKSNGVVTLKKRTAKQLSLLLWQFFLFCCETDLNRMN